jgi:hypothetical protein
MASYAPIGQAAFYSTPFGYSPLLSDGDDVVSRSASMASGGGVVKRGAILKWDPATGLLTQPAAATDCNCILSNDIDATSAAATAIVYVGGKFKADAIIWPGALSHALVTDALRSHDMQIESVVFTDGTLVKAAPSQAAAQNAQAVVEQNRSEGDAAKAAAATIDPKTGEPKIEMDSPWAYLTPEEREKSPELAQAPTAKELVESAPDVAPVTLSPTSDNTGANAETSTFQVTMTGAEVGRTWTAVADPASPWLTVVSPTGPQTASGSVTYAVAANTGATRTGKITVNDQTYMVTQAFGS